MKAVLPALARGLLEADLPAGLDVAWYVTPEDADAMIVDADIAWIDLQSTAQIRAAVDRAERLGWYSTLRAGVDYLDLERLQRAGVTVTNGAGVNANAVAEYAVMAMLVAAKRFDEVVRIVDRQQWSVTAPGMVELEGTSALVIGYGTIGRLIGARLAGFDMAVTGVTRSGRDGTLTPDQWRARLGAFDWVLLCAPSTSETQALIGAAELAAMKPSAWLINFARGSMVDQDALVEALEKRRIAGAFLDVTTPEPLPPGHPLWTAPNVIHSSHLSGRSQTRMFVRAARLFLDNLHAFMAGEPMQNVVDLERGY
jgi:phosphoglycerate dehydrogenase-like enzyme